MLINSASWTRFVSDMEANPDFLKELALRAERWLPGKPPSVVDKQWAAPSGDPHDYLSIGPYYWPDESKAEDSPWVVRDGQVNPAFYEYDSQKLETMGLAVTDLILHAGVSGSVPSAVRAGEFLRTWFLEKETLMNPHLRYAQGIPGGCEGRFIGIIDTTSLVFLLDLIGHLPFNEGWSSQDLAGLRDWVSRYLDWLLDSREGKQEEQQANNHGTWYDAQVVAFAIFCGRPEIAVRQITLHMKTRLTSQLDPDGCQPHEFKRTLSETYCTYNLLAFACLAQMGRSLGLELWTWQDQAGRGLEPALNWMLPYYRQIKPWPGPQIEPFNLAAAALLINLAWQGTHRLELETLSSQLQTRPWQRIAFSKAALTGRNEPKV